MNVLRMGVGGIGGGSKKMSIEDQRASVDAITIGSGGATEKLQGMTQEQIAGMSKTTDQMNAQGAQQSQEVKPRAGGNSPSGAAAATADAGTLAGLQNQRQS